MNKTIKVIVPATTANIGPGFDVLGMACSLHNEVELSLNNNGEINIIVNGEGQNLLPLNDENIIVQAIKTILKRANSSYSGMKLVLTNNVPLARGLGSSAAAIVGGLVAANEYLGKPFTNSELLDIATEFEGHPDNVAPALLGGFCISSIINNKVECIRVLPPQNMLLITAVPDFHLSTHKARQVLPKQIRYEDAIFNMSRTSMIVAAFMKGDIEPLRYLLDDKLHQPYRKSLIPGYDTVTQNAIKAGALGAFISGAGPTIMAIVDNSLETANKVKNAMQQGFEHHNISATTHILKPNNNGAQVV